MQHQNQREAVEQLIAVYRNNDRLHHLALERAIQADGICGSDHRMIGYLYHHQSCENQADIAKAMRISTAAVAVCLSRLEKSGYITRVANATDRRNNTITLTEKGLAIANQTRSVFRKVDLKMFSGLSEEEMALFSQCLNKINLNLKEILTLQQEEQI